LRGLIASWRLAWAIAHVLLGALICLFVFPFLAPAGRMQRVGWWSRRLLHLLGIDVRAHGTLQAAPVLVIANHVSWLDILAVNALRPVRFVSKADVRHWPLLGWLVTCGGTLYIERERKRDALRVVHQVADALRAGDVVAVFPEGTTSAGHGLLPFHGNLLQAAISTQTPVQPLALRYSDARDAVSRAAAYVDEINLIQSVWAVVSAQDLSVEVTVLPATPTGTIERRELAERLRGQVLAVLDPTAAAPTPRGH
jgi:1-acyl-sn-glycerol-3-phosphate acyltransferase